MIFDKNLCIQLENFENSRFHDFYGRNLFRIKVCDFSCYWFENIIKKGLYRIKIDEVIIRYK